MIYGKLPIVFLSTLASEKSGSTNGIIARYLLDHLDEVQDLGIKEMAQQCHVAASSISRFCKDIGLADFMELKDLLLNETLSFETLSPKATFSQRSQACQEMIHQSLEMVARSISAEKVSQLCDDIAHFDRVAAFGLLKAETAAINLQTDLLMLGKNIYTHIAYKEQLQYLLCASNQDLIIIFSYTGAYFDYERLRAKAKRLQAPKIWMITSKTSPLPDFVDESITFDSLQNQASHPYQLLFIANLISQEYAQRKNA